MTLGVIVSDPRKLTKATTSSALQKQADKGLYLHFVQCTESWESTGGPKHRSEEEEEEEEKKDHGGNSGGLPVSLSSSHTFPTDGCVGFRLLLTDLYTLSM